MQSLLGMIQMLLLCGTVLTLAFVVLLALPKSELRTFLMPIVGWAMAIFCGIYAISPVDVVPEVILGPFGLIDDIGAVVAGIGAARMAMNAKNE